jgi:hypothetical protein
MTSFLIKYKNYKKLTAIIRAAEKSYYSDRFTQLKDDIKRTWGLKITWGLIKQIINNNMPSIENIKKLLANGKFSTE